MTIAREEIFGPVLAVLEFDGVEEAVAEGETRASTGWRPESGRATSAGPTASRASLKAGTVWVNAYNLFDPALPFGGFKQSGFGRELGLEALDAYLETKSVWMDLD